MTLHAQRHRNYIYLFDCTWSMKEPNHIWDEAKAFMRDDITQLDRSANITIVLFHQKTSTPICFKAPNFNWKDVENQCEAMIKASRRTGICQAWDLGLKYIDNSRNNYLYLFTDGTENVDKHRTDAVCERIRKWCQQAPNNYAFFVALGDEIKKSPDVQKLIAATQTCDRTFFINDHQGSFGAFDKTVFNLNSHSTKNLVTGFSDYGTFDASVACDDKYYRISLKDNKIKDGKAILIVEQKEQPSCNYQLHFTVNSKEEELHICNNDLFINIDTRDLANLDMGQPSGETEGQYDAGEVETFPSFLFWKGKETDKVQLDLGAVFNGQAQKQNCFLNVSLDIPAEVNDKCQLYYNGEHIKDSFVIKASDTESILSIDVPHKLASKAFTIKLSGISDNLETINAEECNFYVSSIYFEHSICWNPLRVVLMWLVISLLMALIVWIVALRPIIYPRFKSIRKGFYLKDCPPITISFKGARLVILDNKAHQQSVWNRIFKGKIIYKQHSALLTRITMKPHKRGIMVVTDTSKYIITPNPMPRIGSAIMNDLTNRTNIEIK
mgnify:CR=1 FL=1